MTPQIQSKLPAAGTTIFTLMSMLATKHNAINLGQGFPDFPMDQELISLVSRAMKDGFNQYTHMNGLPLLREKIAIKVNEQYQSTIEPESEITVTPGGTYAIYTALTTIIQPGDEVILFEPAYDSYIPAITLNKGIPVCIPMLFPEYVIDWELVKSKITDHTKAIIINSPHNPTGGILGEKDFLQLNELTKNTGIFIISDEVYEHLVFDNKEHLSILKYPDLFSRSFVCFSFGKVYHCTGWKIGYCISPKDLMKEFRKVHQFNAFTCNTPIQIAIAEFINHKDNYQNLGKFVQQKRDYFQKLMSETKFRPLPTSGSYFQLYDYSAISNDPEKDFAEKLTREYGVATIPVSAFYAQPVNNHVLRFCFVKKNETLESAAKKLLSVK